jgi:hypothetical protein
MAFAESYTVVFPLFTDRANVSERRRTDWRCYMRCYMRGACHAPKVDWCSSAASCRSAISKPVKSGL